MSRHRAAPSQLWWPHVSVALIGGAIVVLALLLLHQPAPEDAGSGPAAPPPSPMVQVCWAIGKNLIPHCVGQDPSVVVHGPATAHAAAGRG